MTQGLGEFRAPDQEDSRKQKIEVGGAVDDRVPGVGTVQWETWISISVSVSVPVSIVVIGDPVSPTMVMVVWPSHRAGPESGGAMRAHPMTTAIAGVTTMAATATLGMSGACSQDRKREKQYRTRNKLQKVSSHDCHCDSPERTKPLKLRKLSTKRSRRLKAKACNGICFRRFRHQLPECLAGLIGVIPDSPKVVSQVQGPGMIGFANDGSSRSRPWSNLRPDTHPVRRA